MDKIKEYKHQSISYLILFVLLAILLFGMIMWLSNLEEHLSVVLPMAVACLMTYVHYVSLKTKVEILQELKKKQL